MEKLESSRIKMETAQEEGERLGAVSHTTHQQGWSIEISIHENKHVYENMIDVDMLFMRK
tara:strand:- start:931 stop:1110 length:180 start_codon:yes stop_codon:yes gene_type:complete